MEARHARRPGSRQEMPGRQHVDLIIARKCRRPRKCQAGRQAGQEAGEAAGQLRPSRLRPG